MANKSSGGKSSGGKGASKGGGHSRSAITGRYVTPATAQRHPKTTVTEGGKGKGSGKK